MPALVTENIAYKGNDVPWHGMANRVADNATIEEMQIAGNLNWSVQRRKLAMRGMTGNVLTEPLANYRAIVRSDNDHVFNIATDSYQIVQNSQILDVFREYCDAGHATLETVGGLKGGAIVWALARLNGGTTTVINGVDEVRGYVLLATSHDGTLQTIGKGTQVRVVCWNTLSAALRGNAQFKLKHNSKWTPERAAEAKREMGLITDQMQEVNAVSAKLAKVNIDQADWLEFMANVIGKEGVLKAKGTDTEMTGADAIYWNEFVNDVKHGRAVVASDLTRMAGEILVATETSPGANLETAKGTLWGAVNGVTYYADHVRARTQDARLTSAWFGNSDVLKRSALTAAIEMTKN